MHNLVKVIPESINKAESTPLLVVVTTPTYFSDNEQHDPKILENKSSYLNAPKSAHM